MVYKVLWHNMLSVRPGTSGRTFSLYDKCTELFYVHYTWDQNGLTSNSKDKAIAVKCLAQGHQASGLGLKLVDISVSMVLEVDKLVPSCQVLIVVICFLFMK